jgi:hypothetical protein
VQGISKDTVNVSMALDWGNEAQYISIVRVIVVLLSEEAVE